MNWKALAEGRNQKSYPQGHLAVLVAAALATSCPVKPLEELGTPGTIVTEQTPSSKKLDYKFDQCGGLKEVQRFIGIDADGSLGPQTRNALQLFPVFYNSRPFRFSPDLDAASFDDNDVCAAISVLQAEGLNRIPAASYNITIPRKRRKKPIKVQVYVPHEAAYKYLEPSKAINIYSPSKESKIEAEIRQLHEFAALYARVADDRYIRNISSQLEEQAASEAELAWAIQRFTSKVLKSKTTGSSVRNALKLLEDRYGVCMDYVALAGSLAKATGKFSAELVASRTNCGKDGHIMLTLKGQEGTYQLDINRTNLGIHPRWKRCRNKYSASL